MSKNDLLTRSAIDQERTSIQEQALYTFSKRDSSDFQESGLSCVALFRTRKLCAVGFSTIKKISARLFMRRFNCFKNAVYTAFFLFYAGLRIFFRLRMAHAAHRATGATATTGSFSFFLITAELQDDHRADCDQERGDQDRCEVFCDPDEHRKSLLSKIITLQLLFW